MKKSFIFLLTVFFLSSKLYAYKKGDEVDAKVLQQLGIKSNELAVVDFFASWCVSCEKELPLINALTKDASLKKVRFVGVDTDESKEEGLAFQKKLGLEFFVFNDSKQEVVSKFSPIGMPALYYIKDKKVVKVIFGAINYIDKIVKKDLEQL